MTKSDTSTLTVKERQTLVLTGKGLSIPEIAEAMNIPERTAKYYSDCLRKKLGVSKRRQLIGLAAKVKS